MSVIIYYPNTESYLLILDNTVKPIEYNIKHDKNIKKYYFSFKKNELTTSIFEKESDILKFSVKINNYDVRLYQTKQLLGKPRTVSATVRTSQETKIWEGNLKSAVYEQNIYD